MDFLAQFLCLTVFLGISGATVYSLVKFRGSVTGGSVGVLFALADVVTDALRHPPDNTGLIGLVALQELWFFACVGTISGTIIGACYRRTRKVDAIKNDRTTPQS